MLRAKQEHMPRHYKYLEAELIQTVRSLSIGALCCSLTFLAGKVVVAIRGSSISLLDYSLYRLLIGFKMVRVW